MGNRNEKGRFTEKASLKDVRTVFDTVEGPAVVTTSDVAEETGLSRDSARQKLKRLRDRGEVNRRETAGQVILYWVVSPGVGEDNDITASDLREPADQQ